MKKVKRGIIGSEEDRSRKERDKEIKMESKKGREYKRRVKRERLK